MFPINQENIDYNINDAKELIEFLEGSNRVNFFEPKKSISYILVSDDINPYLKYNNEKIAFASRGLCNTYRNLDSLLLNIHFFLDLCPVCGRVDLSDFDAHLEFCPECNLLDRIAYPFLNLHSMLKPDYQPSDREEQQDLWESLDDDTRNAIGGFDE